MDDRLQFKVHTDERTQVHSARSSWRSPIQELTEVDMLNFNEQAIELTLVATVNLYSQSRVRHWELCYRQTQVAFTRLVVNQPTEDCCHTVHFRSRAASCWQSGIFCRLRHHDQSFSGCQELRRRSWQGPIIGPTRRLGLQSVVFTHTGSSTKIANFHSRSMRWRLRPSPLTVPSSHYYLILKFNDPRNCQHQLTS
jgi:hypothetical protein